MRHEWRQLWRDRTSPAAVVLLLLVAGYGLANGRVWIAAQSQQVVRAQDEERSRLARMEAELVRIEAGTATPGRFRDPAKASWVGEFLGNRFTTWPPDPLASWAVGQRDLMPYVFRITTLSREAFIFTEELENPLNLALGRFDLAFVVVFLLPLVAVAVSYDMLAAEREAGTLRMTLAFPVRLGHLLVAKVLARIIVCFALIAAIGLLAILFMGPGRLDSEVLLRAALWLSAAGLYVVFWIVLAAALNVSGRSAASRAVWLLGAWLFFAVLVPAAVGMLASARYPAPSRLVIHQTVRELGRQLAPHAQNILERHYDAHPDQRPDVFDQTDWAPRFYAVQQRRDQIVQRLHEEHDRQVRGQQAFVDRFRWLSPTLLMHGTLTELARTSMTAFQDFIAQVDGYHHAWQAFFFPRIFRAEPLTPSDYALIPRYRYQPEPEAALRGRAAVNLWQLAVLTVLLAMLATLQLRRRSVL